MGFFVSAVAKFIDAFEFLVMEDASGGADTMGIEFSVSAAQCFLMAKHIADFQASKSSSIFV